MIGQKTHMTLINEINRQIRVYHEESRYRTMNRKTIARSFLIVVKTTDRAIDATINIVLNQSYDYCPQGCTHDVTVLLWLPPYGCPLYRGHEGLTYPLTI